MSNSDFSTSITVAKSPHEIFSCLLDVSQWWSKDFKGHSAALGDEFVIDHGIPHFSRQKVVEVIPDKKVVWLVTDSTLNWLTVDQHEWTNTRMIFEITPKDHATELQFTHEGLVPEKECYSRCSQGWNMVIGERLLTFINTGKSILV